MNYTSTVSHQSKTHTGVSFVVRRLTEGRRIALRLELADAMGRIQDVFAAREEFQQEMAAKYGVAEDELRLGQLTPRERGQLAKFSEQSQCITDAEINPAYFRACFVSIDGFTIDGQKPDAALMLAEAPGDLIQEIMAAILGESGLSHEEKENLESPSTSGAAVDGKASSTNARPVNVVEITSGATAASTSSSA